MGTQQPDWRTPVYCWMGGARYTNPLDKTSAKKWHMMADLGIQMVVLGFSTTLRPRRFHEHAEFILLPMLPVSALRHLFFLAVAPLLALWVVFRHPAVVLIAQSPYEGSAAAFARQVARVFGRRAALVVESHGDFQEAFFAYRRVRGAGLYRRFMRATAAYALRHADVLRAISQATTEQLRSLAPDKPLVQFMTWTDADVFMQTERAAPPSRSRELLFAGILAPVKGVDHLLDAFGQVAAAFPDVCLTLVGQAANSDYTDSLRAQIMRAGLERRVTFVGAVGQAVLAQHMARARVLVLPSLSEGLGRVVVEAMLCGAPVIGSAVGGIPEMIRDGLNGWLVPPGDVDALAAAIRTALEMDAASIDTLGRQANEFARQFCSNDAYIDGYRRLFECAATVLQRPDGRTDV